MILYYTDCFGFFFVEHSTQIWVVCRCDQISLSETTACISVQHQNFSSSSIFVTIEVNLGLEGVNLMCQICMEEGMCMHVCVHAYTFYSNSSFLNGIIYY